MPSLHIIHPDAASNSNTERLSLESGTVCRKFSKVKRVLISSEDRDQFKINVNLAQKLVPFEDSVDFDELQTRILEFQNDFENIVLVFTTSSFRLFKNWVRSSNAVWASSVAYFLVSKTCNLQFQCKEISRLPNEKLLNKEIQPQRNTEVTKRTILFYWASLTKGTKFGFFWLPFRAITGPIPILFTALQASASTGGLVPFEQMFLSLSLFSLMEGGIKHGVRSWRRLKNFDQPISSLQRFLFLGLVGTIESVAFLVAAIALSLLQPTSGAWAQIILIWIASIPIAVFFGGVLGLATEYVAKKFWDVKFLTGHVSLLILITTPVLFVPTDGLLQKVQHYNPLSFTFRLCRSIGENLSTTNSTIISLNLAMFLLLMAMMLRKEKMNGSISNI